MRQQSCLPTVFFFLWIWYFFFIWYLFCCEFDIWCVNRVVCLEVFVLVNLLFLCLYVVLLSTFLFFICICNIYMNHFIFSNVVVGQVKWKLCVSDLDYPFPTHSTHSCSIFVKGSLDFFRIFIEFIGGSNRPWALWVYSKSSKQVSSHPFAFTADSRMQNVHIVSLVPPLCYLQQIFLLKNVHISIQHKIWFSPFSEMLPKFK